MSSNVTISLSSIELDTSIQCRASIDTSTVDEYAERMREGDEFPPVVLFGTHSQCWPGDGWHRCLAAEAVGLQAITATLHEGGRAEALRYALGANAHHGQRRTNADKRRCVEIALREFPTLSSRGIAEMCGVSHMTVQRTRPSEVEHCSTSETVTGLDGKQHPATRPAPDPVDEFDDEPEPIDDEPIELDGDDDHVVSGHNRLEATDRPSRRPPPRMGTRHAWAAIRCLEEIKKTDLERDEAFAMVRHWLNEQS